MSPNEIQKVQAELQALALQARTRMKERLQAGMESGDSASNQPGGKLPIHGKKSLLDTLMDSDSDDSNKDDDDQEDEGEMLRKEVQMYFGEHKKDRNLSPLQWWRDNEGKFPNLALLARSYLAVPATSTPSERLFSAAGNIVSKKRASLTPDHVDMLTFLHFNA